MFVRSSFRSMLIVSFDLKIEEELNERIKTHEQFKDQLDQLISKFSDQWSAEDVNEGSPLDRLQSILQAKTDPPQTLISEISDEKNPEDDRQAIIDEVTRLKDEASERRQQLTEIATCLGSESDDGKGNTNYHRSDFGIVSLRTNTS